MAPLTRKAVLVLLLLAAAATAAAAEFRSARAAAAAACQPVKCPEQCVASSSSSSSSSRKRSGSSPPQTKVNDYVLHDGAMWNNDSTLPPIIESWTLNYYKTRSFVYRISNPLHHFSIVAPNNRQCPGYGTTSETAKAAGCVLAINAGFFNRSTGDCIGNVVSHGHRVEISGIENVNFALLKNGSYLVGYITQEMVWKDEVQFSELISGMLWILREGKPYYCESYGIERPMKSFLDQTAARSLIGHDVDGRLYLIIVEVNPVTKVGVSIYDLANIASYVGLWNAVNLDGGGSTTLYENGEILNVLTDGCAPGQTPAGYQKKGCERPLTTIACVR